MDIVVDSRLERVHNSTDQTAWVQPHYGEHTCGRHCFRLDKNYYGKRLRLFKRTQDTNLFVSDYCPNNWSHHREQCDLPLVQSMAHRGQARALSRSWCFRLWSPPGLGSSGFRKPRCHLAGIRRCWYQRRNTLCDKNRWLCFNMSIIFFSTSYTIFRVMRTSS